MSKLYIRLLVAFLVLFGLLLYWESTLPDPVDWKPSYSIKDKIPLGTYVFYETLSEVAQDIEITNATQYDFFDGFDHRGTYIQIDQSAHIWDGTVNKMMDWIEQGNTVLISASHHSIFSSDSLGLDYKMERSSSEIINHPIYNFYNPELASAKTYNFGRNMGLSYFSKIDTLNHRALGWTSFKKTDSVNLEKRINFIEIPHGKGRLLLHTSPQAFSNYFLLQGDNLEYVEKLLAYVDVESTIYYDVSGDPHFRKGGMRTSMLYVILENKYLRKAYYVLLFGVLLFVIFEGKRKQKPIEVVEPLQNKSYDFVRTISGLYLDKKNHTAMAHKKIEQFLGFVRTELKTNTDKIDASTLSQIAEMSQNTREDTKELFNFIKSLQQNTEIKRWELKQLNKKINHFKRNI